jgi:hypothetical protein
VSKELAAEKVIDWPGMAVTSGPASATGGLLMKTVVSALSTASAWPVLSLSVSRAV